MVRLLYFILKFTLPYSLRIVYKRVRTIGSPNEFYGRTIYVSNHASSFMDPLIVASLRKPIVFFMTRADIFNPAIQPILWASHMLPIYRQHDGEDTKAKNDEVFQKCQRILSFGRNLLIFGEGFTDDVFVRRLKPVKKGAARIAFGALESTNWEKKMYMAAVGVNYTDPGMTRSEVLVETSKKICLNDYREVYEQNPNKAINDVTKRIEKMMQETITHVEDIELCPIHENIMMLTRKGMHPECSDETIDLVERRNYSQNLAKVMNQLSDEEKSQLEEWNKEVTEYLKNQRKFKTKENDVHLWKTEKKVNHKRHLILGLFLFPFAILGAIHTYIPYKLIKGFVEKSFKRKVFWSSVKMLLSKIAVGVINIPVIFLFAKYVYPSIWAGIAYYLLIGLFFLAFYQCRKHLGEYKRKSALRKTKLEEFAIVRSKLIEKLENTAVASAL